LAQISLPRFPRSSCTCYLRCCSPHDTCRDRRLLWREAVVVRWPQDHRISVQQFLPTNTIALAPLVPADVDRGAAQPVPAACFSEDRVAGEVATTTSY